MNRGNVYLDADQLAALEQLAVEQHRSVGELVRQAVDAYLKGYLSGGKNWGARFDRLLQAVQHRKGDGRPTTDIEADISAALDRVRARRTRTRHP